MDDAGTIFGDSPLARNGSEISEIGTNRVGIDTDWTQIESAMMQDELAIV